MLFWKSTTIVKTCLAVVLFGVGCAVVKAGEAKNAVTIVDYSGKEHKLASWKFTTGTRHLTWLATATEKKLAAKTPANVGLEVLEVSEGKKPPLRTRVLTLVSVKNIRAIEFDHKKNAVTVRVATKDKDLVLEGVTGYIGVNMFALEAETDLGELGKATLKFRGGVNQGIRSVRFSSPVPVTEVPKGRAGQVTASGREQAKHNAIDLQALFMRQDRSLFVEPALDFQKTVHIDLDKIAKLSQVGSNAARGGLVFDVTLKSGLQKPLVLVQSRRNAQKRGEFLQGLIGRVPSGYKLFPMRTVERLTFGN